MGKDITPTNLKGKWPSKDTYKLPEEYIEFIKSTLEKEVEKKLEAEKAIVAQMKEELEIEKEKWLKKIMKWKKRWKLKKQQ